MEHVVCEAHVIINVDVAEDLPEVWWDAEQIEEALVISFALYAAEGRACSGTS
jgi:hypothetical protein